MRPIITALVLLIASNLSAQSFDAPSATLGRATAPNEPGQVFSKKIFWAETGAYSLFNILDGYTTVVRPPGYQEARFPHGSAFMLGTSPSVARYALIMGGMQVATSFAAYRLEHSQKRFLRLVGHTLMLQGTYAHADGYIGNVVVTHRASSLPQTKLAPTATPLRNKLF